MITGRQIRNARALLQWDVSKLAKRTGIDLAVILRAESVDHTPSITLSQAGIIQQTFERAGLRFGSGGGVTMAAGKRIYDSIGCRGDEGQDTNALQAVGRGRQRPTISDSDAEHIGREDGDAARPALDQ